MYSGYLANVGAAEFRLQGLGFGAEGSGLGVYGLSFRVQGSGLKFQKLDFSNFRLCKLISKPQRLCSSKPRAPNTPRTHGSFTASFFWNRLGVKGYKGFRVSVLGLRDRG